MNMFVGRKAEMDNLNEAFDGNKFEMPIIYGRRRVGKTRLIQEFCEGKKSIFYVAIEQTDASALVRFSEVVLKSIASDSGRFISTFSSWEQAFEFIAESAKNERIVLVLDELPYIAASNTSFLSLLQATIDHKFLDTQLFLILCGSSMSFMENQVLGYESPIYGRRTQQYKIEPLPYYEALRFFDNWNEVDALYAYGVAGGIPMYLNRLAIHKDFKTAVIKELLSTQGYLFEEPSNLIKQEMREPAIYNTIIETIGKGETKQSNIASKSNINSNKLDYYLKNLLNIGVVEKTLPFGSNNNRQTLYKLSDNLFKFWFKFIPDNLPLIEMRDGEYLFDEIIYPRINTYFGFVFEEICKQYLYKVKHRNNVPFINIGSWWGSDPETKIQEEIDIIAETKDVIIFGECKWTNSPISQAVLDKLIRRSSLVKNSKLPSYVLFSKTGFTVEYMQSVELIDLSQILSLVYTRG